MVAAVQRGEGAGDLDHGGEGVFCRQQQPRACDLRILSGAPPRRDHRRYAGATGRGGLAMTPTIPELLRGCAAALSKPPCAEDAGVFADARLLTVATINQLVAQECANGV